MSKLFEEIAIKDLKLQNRFVRSATWEGLATEEGFCTQKLSDMLVQLIRGQVGLVITGHAYVSPEGQASPWQLAIHRDELISGLSEMTGTVHRTGGKIFVQIAHAGCHAITDLTKQEALGPSVMKNENGPLCRAVTVEEIQRIVEAFGNAAARAQKAGFDGVQIHAAHGYLLSQFLSPFYNKREDEYGGSAENRARIVLEILHAVKSRVGERFPVAIKINSEDFVEGGLNVDGMVETASMLEKAGVDAIELSGGVFYSGKYNAIRRGKLDSMDEEVFYKEAARKYKERIKVPLMLVGGIRSFEVAERLIDDGLTDFISLSRPLIREPDLIKRWQSGDTHKAECQSDNLCFKPGIQGEGIYCVVEKKYPDRAKK
jgi:2,4-dienoyl-CoA reductase-like NADH-dependent reductase (Old Yellow Enzyme family)